MECDVRVSIRPLHRWGAVAGVVLTAAALGLPAPAVAQTPAPAATTAPLKTRSTMLPSKGLFVGDQLSDAARARLTDFIIDAIGQQIEVALVVPHGAWNAEGSGKDERDLTPARLQSVRKFLGDRGVDARRIFVESRIDPNAREARLEIQTVSRPATD